MMQTDDSKEQSQAPSALGSSGVVRPAHPWKRNWEAKLNAQAKLKTAREEARRRRNLKYRNENLEDRRAMERHWHRKKAGLPIEAPKMKPWDHARRQESTEQ